MNYKIALIGLIILVLIGTVAAYTIVFNKAQSNDSVKTETAKLESMIISSKASFIPMFGKSTDHKASFLEILNKKFQAPVLMSVIYSK